MMEKLKQLEYENDLLSTELKKSQSRASSMNARCSKLQTERELDKLRLEAIDAGNTVIPDAKYEELIHQHIQTIEELKEKLKEKDEKIKQLESQLSNRKPKKKREFLRIKNLDSSPSVSKTASGLSSEGNKPKKILQKIIGNTHFFFPRLKKENRAQ
jgi:phage shock protein A